jgi:hypothetical protein
MGWRLPGSVNATPVFVSGHWSLPPEVRELLTSSAACSLKKKSSHGGHGVHGVIFGEARLKTGIKRLING